MLNKQHAIDCIIEKLHSHKVYSYKDLDVDSSDASIRCAISRRKNKIRMLSRGKFIIPSFNAREKSKLFDKPHEQQAIKRGSISAKKLILSKNIFYSNKNGQIPVNNIIVSVIKDGSMNDIDAIRYKFGDNKVIEVLLEEFDVHESKISRICNVIGL